MTDLVERHRALLGRLLPGDDLGGLDVREGQFHHVVIGSARVVCLPRTPAAAARLPARAAVLRTLAGFGLGFRVPVPVASDGERYLVLDRIPGAPLPDGEPAGPRTSEAVARQYAALLAELARAGADQTVRDALPHQEPDRWRRFADDVRAELYPLMSAAGRGRAERELTPLAALPHITTAVVHGDLGAANVLWETAGGAPRLAGVVDWDEAGLGDPAEDLAAIAASHGTHLLDRIIALTGGPAAALLARADVIRGTFALQQALSAHRDGDAAELADGLARYV
ncbi:viomycin phosphotransferase [Spongiactinospora rosea]|uniref:Viomycin phosphotransferase n=1 Tax=Spongiactinospora rosea TaxID=2248750 RepID=A0A366M379_9ACTN|nr:phosphotransferase [Spongiactinospora rosea]RBQ20497.1 viomycin phosphotransferase [Spongiactinospora rosea]